jgi:hypothetical protein
MQRGAGPWCFISENAVRPLQGWHKLKAVKTPDVSPEGNHSFAHNSKMKHSVRSRICLAAPTMGVSHFYTPHPFVFFRLLGILWVVWGNHTLDWTLDEKSREAVVKCCPEVNKGVAA